MSRVGQSLPSRDPPAGSPSPLRKTTGTVPPKRKKKSQYRAATQSRNNESAVTMKTRFYDRTAYSLSSEPVPNCFLALDEYFDGIIIERQQIPLNHLVLLAESVCGRMADVEMYAFLLEDVRKRETLEREEDDRAAILSRSFLLGFISAARGLLDSSAVTLATLYDLPLNQSDQSFSSGDFWHQLVLHVPAVHRRYHPLRLFLNEVFRWQQETVYRLPPLLSLHAHYGHLPGRDAQLRVVDDINFNLEQLAHEPYSVNWIDPLQLYGRWKPRLLALCEKVCVDIENVSKKRMRPGDEPDRS
jgi:hypothetical protein